MLKLRDFILLISILFSFCLLNSCNAQHKNNIDITGNWFNYNDTDEIIKHDSFYVEIFIDENYFYYYNEFSGLLPSIHYSIENNAINLDFSNIDSTSNKVVIKKIDKDTFTLSSEGEVLIYKRIKQDKTLELLLQDKINEDDYFNNFIERKLNFISNKK